LLFGPVFLIQYDLSLLNFKFNRSFLKNLIISPIGVTIKKKIIPIIKGLKNLLKNIPNLNQITFKEVRALEFKIPNKRNIKDIINAQTLTLLALVNGYKPIIKKIIKKTIPKLLLEII
tara:strand:+ start:1166 stop:1519 length:354 start_codon:yes stop_codon:yes gene_type:complete